MITKAQALRALQFVRVLDAQNNLSLTNIGVVVMSARLLMLPNLTVHDLGAFLGTLVAYQVKKFAQPMSGVADDTAALQTAVAELQTKVTGIQMAQARR